VLREHLGQKTLTLTCRVGLTSEPSIEPLLRRPKVGEGEVMLDLSEQDGIWNYLVACEPRASPHLPLGQVLLVFPFIGEGHRLVTV
jgi:hypothetical protein